MKEVRLFFGLFALFWNAVVISAALGMYNKVLARESDVVSLLALIPFGLIGLGMVYMAILPKHLLTFASSGKESGIPEIADSKSRGQLELKPSTSPGKKLGGILAFSIFWNGLIFPFFFRFLSDFASGHGDLFSVIFMLPFVLAGLGSIAVVIYFLLAMANPRPVLKIMPPAVHPGESMNLEWRLSGQAERLENLKITIEGKEEAQYRRGTTTYTDSAVFFSRELVHARGVSQIRRGSTSVEIPKEAMHTFHATNNKIIWSVKMHGEIPKWPDVKETFEITVLPFELDAIKQLEAQD